MSFLKSIRINIQQVAENAEDQQQIDQTVVGNYVSVSAPSVSSNLNMNNNNIISLNNLTASGSIVLTDGTENFFSATPSVTTIKNAIINNLQLVGQSSAINFNGKDLNSVGTVSGSNSSFSNYSLDALRMLYGEMKFQNIAGTTIMTLIEGSPNIFDCQSTIFRVSNIRMGSNNLIISNSSGTGIATINTTENEVNFNAMTVNATELKEGGQVLQSKYFRLSGGTITGYTQIAPTTSVADTIYMRVNNMGFYQGDTVNPEFRIRNTDHATGSNYALAQNHIGNTFVNGNLVQIRTGNVARIAIGTAASGGNITFNNSLTFSQNLVLSPSTTSQAVNHISSPSLYIGIGADENTVAFKHASVSHYCLQHSSGGATRLNGSSVLLCTGQSANYEASATNFRAANDGGRDLGASSFRWKDIFATNGTIQTSDETLKTNIQSLDNETYHNFLLNLNPISYHWISEDDGQVKFGYSAQHTETIRNQFNLPDNALVYEFDKQISDEEGNLSTVLDNQGNPVKTYSMKYTEFIPLLNCSVKFLNSKIQSDLIPDQDDLRDIGSSSKRYQDLYLSGNIYQTSDIKFKENIKEISPAIVEAISKFQAVEYNMKGKKTKRYGLIAQDVKDVLGREEGIVNQSPDGYSINYLDLIAPLISYTQSLEKKISNLEEKFNQFETFMTDISGSLNEIKQQRIKTRALKSPRA